MATFKTVLCCLAVALSFVSAAQAHSQNFPAFFWSGKERFNGKSQHFQRCDSRGLSSLVENVVFDNTKTQSPYFKVEHEKPKVFLAFVHPHFSSHDFLKHSGGFRAEDKTPFTNLRNFVQNSASSLVFPSCHSQGSLLQSMNLISERNPSNVVNVHSHQDSVDDSIHLDSFKQNIASFIKPDQTNFVVLTLDQRSQPSLKGESWYSHMDRVIGEVVEQVHQETDGDYVAMLTSEHEQPRNRRTLLAFEQLKADDGFDPWHPKIVSENITSVSLTIIISFVIFFLIACFGMQQLHDVKTAPHIVDTIGATI